MEDFLNRKYKLKSAEHFESYLKTLGIGLLFRKAATTSSPTVWLSKNDDDSYTLNMATTLTALVIEFKLDEEFEESRPDGTKVKTVFTYSNEDGKLVQTQTESNDRKTTHVREFTADVLSVTTTVDGWDGVCTRTYKALG